MVLAIGLWTALLAVGLCLALLAGQNKYLGKSLFAPGRVPLALVIIGRGRGRVRVRHDRSGALLRLPRHRCGETRLPRPTVGWVLLGGLLGWGVSFFIPNLDGKKAALAGLGGGFLGGLTFWVMSSAAEWVGRFGGAALLGFCIGLMVAVVEVAFRRAWLEVRFSEREVITVNLGPEPVKVGGDSRSCTVWARGAAAIALRYWIRDGKVHCEDVPTKRESTAADGDTRTAGGVTVVVRTGHAPAGSAPPVPARPAVPPRQAAPPPVPAAPTVAVPPRPTAPAPNKPAPAKPTQPDYDDGLPMPMGPPPPARAGATSILDIDDLRGAAPAQPAPKPPGRGTPGPGEARGARTRPAKSMAPPAPKPPVPPAATSMKPPPAAAKSIAPPAPKPPAGGATAGGPKPGEPDACPSCGRKQPGKPGARYCMVCDKTF